MTIRIELSCDRCRGSNISIPIYGGDDTVADCEDCGAKVGTLADLKTQMSLYVLGRKTEDRTQASFDWGNQAQHEDGRRFKRGAPHLRVVRTPRERSFEVKAARR